MSNLKKCVYVEKVNDLKSADYGKYNLLIAGKKAYSAWSLVSVVSHALLLYYDETIDNIYFEANLFELMQKAGASILQYEGSF